ncbi:MAG TPA: ATP-binding protein [Gammaproteobacteria bacterium]|nr:ATP-binding protein [Gammaproteobacteria bacterium]
MSLRAQLLVFGVLTLVLPWTAIRYVEEMEAALRGGLEQSLLASAATVAAALEEQGAALCAAEQCGGSTSSSSARGTTIYAAPLASEPSLDGVRDDWNVADDSALVLPDGPRIFAGVRGRFAYLFVAVHDPDVVYRRQPGQAPYGDRVVLATEPTPGAVSWLLLATSAPGAFRAQQTRPELFEPTESYDERVIGAWQETADGYAVEVRIPLALVSAGLGVGVIDVDRAGGDYAVALSATWDAATGEPGRFIYQRPELGGLLAPFGRAGGRFRVLDTDGWVLADAGRVAAPAEAPERDSLLADLFRLALRRNDPPYPAEQPAGRIAAAPLRRALTGESATAWYGRAAGQDAIVAAAVPIAGPQGPSGAVLLEQASDPILTLTNEALVRLMAFTVLASVLVALGLLGYAAWLSLRVRRLAEAAETALGPRGEIRVGMPGEAARDELGDLARSFAQLLARLREHTEYLRTLSGKLSHELRTPLAVVTTSLDNLEHERQTAAADEYLARLRQGAERLDAILVAMSEAAQLEQAIGETRAEPFDLSAVVAACCGAYRDVYPEREIAYRRTATHARVVGSGELVAQLLDKLVENAVSFSPAGSRIDVSLVDDGRELVLGVTNRGPPLPAKMRGRIFDSLVSIREQRDGKPHLGLGLHIVALIAKFHGGRADAEDLPDGGGVVFRVRFPREG